MSADKLTLSSEVSAALAAGTAVVALESTIITHGMAFPANAGTAREVEAEVRAAGAVPATIAILDGHLHVGLEPEQLDALARNTSAAKASRRDMALVSN